MTYSVNIHNGNLTIYNIREQKNVFSAALDPAWSQINQVTLFGDFYIQWKVHEFDFSYTTQLGAEVVGKSFWTVSPSECVQAYVAMCRHCSLAVSYLPFGKWYPAGHILNQDGTEKWQAVQLNLTLEVGQETRLSFRTESSTAESGFWAVRDIDECPSAVQVISSHITTTDSLDKIWNGFKCQALNNRKVVRMQKSSQLAPGSEGCALGKFGPECKYSCEEVLGSQYCHKTTICSETQCICAPGYTGSLCDIPCQQQHKNESYGQDCASKCGHCLGSPCRCDDITGACPQGCQPPYTGTNCHTSRRR